MRRYQLTHTIMALMAVPWKLGIALVLPFVMLGLFLAAVSRATPPQIASVAANLVSEASPIITETGDQRWPALAYNPTTHEYLIIYADPGDLAALPLQPDATPIGAPFVVADGVENIEITVAFNAQTDRGLVVWTQRVEGFDRSVLGQCVSPAGELLGDRIEVAARQGRQRAPAVAGCGNTYLAVWEEDLDAQWDWDFHIYGQQVSGDCHPIGEPITISADYPHPAFQQIQPDIACSPIDNECLVVFRDARDCDKGSGYNDDIYGQRVSCAGEPLLEHDLPVSTQFSEPPGGNKQNAPAVAYDSWRDQYLVVWQDRRNDPDVATEPHHHDIYGQILSGDGMPVGTPVCTNFPIAVAEGDQILPDVAYTRQANEYLVVWEDHRGADADIYARRVSGSGTLMGEEIIVSDALDDQLKPVAIYNEGTSEYLIVWEDHRNQQTSGADIYGRLYQPPEVEWRHLYLPLVSKNHPATVPSDAEERARAWLDQQTVPFERAEDIPGYNREGCTGRVARYKNSVICYPAIPGDALVSFDYCNYGTPDQRRFLGRYGRAALYDQAVGAIAWLMTGEQEKAQRLLDYLSSYQNVNVPVSGAADGSFGFSFNTVGCPEYKPDNRDSFYDMDYLRTGAISWAGYAFVMYQQLTDTARYSDTARLTAEYMLTQQVTDTTDLRFGLLRGGYETCTTTDSDCTPGQIEWVSTEHNVDAYFFLRDLGERTGDARYSLAAQQIWDGLLTRLWNEEKGRFDRGLDPEGQPDDVDALDAASWGAMFLLAVGDEQKARRSLAFAERTYWNQAEGIWGYKPYAGTVDCTNWDTQWVVWSEGSLGMAMAYVKLGDAASLDRARTILAEMAKLQERDPAGGLLYALYPCDELTDFPRAPSVGGTGWFVMALRALADPAVRDAFWGGVP